MGVASEEDRGSRREGRGFCGGRGSPGSATSVVRGVASMENRGSPGSACRSRALSATAAEGSRSVPGFPPARQSGQARRPGGLGRCAWRPGMLAREDQLFFRRLAAESPCPGLYRRGLEARSVMRVHEEDESVVDYAATIRARPGSQPSAAERRGLSAEQLEKESGHARRARLLSVDTRGQPAAGPRARGRSRRR